MVVENRMLEFSFGELKDAIELFHQEKLNLYPTGEIVSILLLENPSIIAKIVIAPEVDTDGTEVTIQSSTLAAVILYYCKYIKIPIPRTSQKELGRVGDGISLSISMGNT